MPLSSIGASIATAIGGIASFLTSGTLLAKVVVAGLSIAARYAVQAIFGQDRAEQQPAQASQLEIRYGEDLARTIILGRCGTAGHHIYRNAYGHGNRNVEDVYVVSHFRTQELRRVRYNGEWLGFNDTVHPNLGVRIDTDAEIYVKFYDGTQTTADPGLIDHANPAGRWTAAHVGVGCSYVVITSVLDREKLPSPPSDLLFEIDGPLLYDFRKDDTVGGSGDDRFGDQDSWSGNYESPALQMYALERGFFIGSEMMVGKGVDASDLPIAEWSVAANICDEQVSLANRYLSAAIVSSGKGVTHDANMQPLLEACAGSWVELVGDEYPIVGAAQASVATITDDDLVTGAPRRVSNYRPHSELVNTVAATYLPPDTFYQPAPLATRIDAVARPADGERLAVQIPYRAVTSSAVADRLSDIALRASRYQANGEIAVRPKFLGLKPGQWFTWQSDHFEWTKSFQVLTKQLGSFGTNSARNVFLSIQEVSDGIFDPTAYTTVPPDGTGRGAPTYRSQLDNFVVSPYTVVNEDLKQYPAIRATWDAPDDDPTIIGTDIEYWPVNQNGAAIAHPTVPDDVSVVTIADGIISSTAFAGRYRLVTSPYRATPWVDWGPVTTNDTPINDVLVSLREVAADIRNLAQRLIAFQNDVSGRVESLAGSTAEGLGATGQEIAAVVRTSNALAASFLLLDAAITDDEMGLTALATAILGVEASVDNLSAGGLISFEAEVSPGGGAVSQINILARASDEDSFVQSGFVIRVYSDGGGGFTSRIAVLTDQLVIADPDGDELDFPFVFEDGVLKLNSMWAKTVTAGKFQNDGGTSYLDMRTGSTGLKLTF